MRAGIGREAASESRELTPEELGDLAQTLIAAADVLEARRIRERLVRGFYGAGEAG